ncbi:MAG: hypothetical protein LBI87_01435 [Candidatus Accumulibacter sp.]|nr:hypothetical protein [Accumulibacter sp.]
MRRSAPEGTSWIPAFAGMTGPFSFFTVFVAVKVLLFSVSSVVNLAFYALDSRVRGNDGCDGTGGGDGEPDTGRQGRDGGALLFAVPAVFVVVKFFASAFRRACRGYPGFASGVCNSSGVPYHFRNIGPKWRS